MTLPANHELTSWIQSTLTRAERWMRRKRPGRGGARVRRWSDRRVAMAVDDGISELVVSYKMSYRSRSRKEMRSPTREAMRRG
jgi:hypothetical protein